MNLKLTSPNPTPAEIAALYAQVSARLTPAEISRRSEEYKPVLRRNIRIGRALIPELSPTDVTMAIFPRLEIVQSLSKRDYGTWFLFLMWLATQLPEEEGQPSDSVEVTAVEVTAADVVMWQRIWAQMKDG